MAKVEEKRSLLLLILAVIVLLLPIFYGVASITGAITAVGSVGTCVFGPPNFIDFYYPIFNEDLDCDVIFDSCGSDCAVDLEISFDEVYCEDSYELEFESNTFFDYGNINFISFDDATNVANYNLSFETKDLCHDAVSNGPSHIINITAISNLDSSQINKTKINLTMFSSSLKEPIVDARLHSDRESVIINWSCVQMANTYEIYNNSDIYEVESWNDGVSIPHSLRIIDDLSSLPGDCLFIDSSETDCKNGIGSIECNLGPRAPEEEYYRVGARINSRYDIQNLSHDIVGKYEITFYEGNTTYFGTPFILQEGYDELNFLFNLIDEFGVGTYDQFNGWITRDTHPFFITIFPDQRERYDGHNMSDLDVLYRNKYFYQENYNYSEVESIFDNHLSNMLDASNHYSGWIHDPVTVLGGNYWMMDGGTSGTYEPLKLIPGMGYKMENINETFEITLVGKLPDTFSIDFHEDNINLFSLPTVKDFELDSMINLTNVLSAVSEFNSNETDLESYENPVDANYPYVLTIFPSQRERYIGKPMSLTESIKNYLIYQDSAEYSSIGAYNSNANGFLDASNQHSGWAPHPTTLVDEENWWLLNKGIDNDYHPLNILPAMGYKMQNIESNFIINFEFR